jgi:hypothetical protein
LLYISDQFFFASIDARFRRKQYDLILDQIVIRRERYESSIGTEIDCIL